MNHVSLDIAGLLVSGDRYPGYPERFSHCSVIAPIAPQSHIENIDNQLNRDVLISEAALEDIRATYCSKIAALDYQARPSCSVYQRCSCAALANTCSSV